MLESQDYEMLNLDIVRDNVLFVKSLLDFGDVFESLTLEVESELKTKKVLVACLLDSNGHFKMITERNTDPT